MNDTEIMHELAANMLLVSSANIFFLCAGRVSIKVMLTWNSVYTKNYIN